MDTVIHTIEQLIQIANHASALCDAMRPLIIKVCMSGVYLMMGIGAIKVSRTLARRSDSAAEKLSLTKLPGLLRGLIALFRIGA